MLLCEDCCVGKCDRTEGMRSVQWPGGELARPVYLDSSQWPSWRQGWSFPLGMGRTLLTWGSLFQGRRVWESQSDFSASVVSWNSFSLKYSICQGDIIWDSMTWTPSTPLFDQMSKRPDNFAFFDHTLSNYQNQNHRGDKLYIYKYCFSTRSRPTLLSNSCWAHS